MADGLGPFSKSATLAGDQAHTYLGESVAGAGDVNADGYDDVVVGASWYSSGEPGEGAAFVFLGGPLGIASGGPGAADAQLESNDAGAHMGVAVAGAGDVNGDGFDDVIVGAPQYGVGGAVFVFLGGPGGLASGGPSTAAAMLLCSQADAHFGARVAAGDVNGDGRPDVLVAAPSYDAGQLQEGAVFVFLGSPAGIPSGGPESANATLEGNQIEAHFGTSVAVAGHVNDDAYADVIVGAYAYDAGQPDEGAAFVFLGGPGGIASGGPGTAAATLQSDQAGARFGQSVAGAGDVDADGYDDVIVGAYYFDTASTDDGAAFVFLGSQIGVPSGSPWLATRTLVGAQLEARLGTSVAGVGDLDGDGYDDLAVGAYHYDSPVQPDAGATFLFKGGEGVQSIGSGDAWARLSGGQAGAMAGWSVAKAGDLNGDGYPDLIASAAAYDAGGEDSGAAFVYLGGYAKGDLNGDFKTDLYLRRQSDATYVAWLMNGTQRTGEVYLSPTPENPNLRLVGVDDFDGDLRNDLVFRDLVSGATEFWRMVYSLRLGSPVPLLYPPGPTWKLVATADFNHDRKPDLVFWNAGTHSLEIWLLDDMNHRGTLVPAPDPGTGRGFAPVAAADWNGDGNTDLLWFSTASGEARLSFMDANAQIVTSQITNPSGAGGTTWTVGAAGDYGIGTGGLAGTNDLVWRSSTSGSLVVWHLDKAGNRTSGVFTTPSAPTPNPTDWTLAGPR